MIGRKVSRKRDLRISMRILKRAERERKWPERKFKKIKS